LVQGGFILSGFNLPSLQTVNVPGGGAGIALTVGPNLIPSDVWTAWKTQVGNPSGLNGVVVSGP
jgi:hypothetical protein